MPPTTTAAPQNGPQDSVSLGQGQAAELDADKLARFRSGMLGGSGTSSSVMSRPLFSGEPNYRAISQGRHGDCLFLASVINLAKNEPEKLKRMIAEKKDGTYDVTLRAGKTINVKPLTDEERKKAASAGCNGEWLSILEKAYLKDSNALRSYKILGDMANPFTYVDTVPITSERELKTDITNALEKKKTIVVGKSRQLFGKKDLPDKHAYAVIGIEGDKVTVMNPWGFRSGDRGELRNADGKARDGVGDGIMEMSLEEFKKQFTFIVYRNPELGRGV